MPQNKLKYPHFAVNRKELCIEIGLWTDFAIVLMTWTQDTSLREERLWRVSEGNGLGRFQLCCRAGNFQGRESSQNISHLITIALSVFWDCTINLLKKGNSSFINQSQSVVFTFQALIFLHCVGQMLTCELIIHRNTPSYVDLFFPHSIEIKND